MMEEDKELFDSIQLTEKELKALALFRARMKEYYDSLPKQGKQTKLGKQWDGN